MAEENIGAIYNTKVPLYSAPADIQEAFRIYHYGSANYDPTNTDPLQLPNPSMARYLAEFQLQINQLNESGIGSEYSDLLPATADAGFIWMDSESTSGGEELYSTAFYSTQQPSENLADGMIWIDKGSALKEAFVWDAALSEWIKINDPVTVVESKGDLLAGTGGTSIARLPVGQDGHVLTASSGTATGLSWQQVSTESFEISSIMGVY